MARKIERLELRIEGVGREDIEAMATAAEISSSEYVRETMSDECAARQIAVLHGRTTVATVRLALAAYELETQTAEAGVDYDARAELARWYVDARLLVEQIRDGAGDPVKARELLRGMPDNMRRRMRQLAEV